MARDDLQAIDVRISTTPLNTKAAEKIHDEWRVWYDGLGYFERDSQSAFDHARNLRNAFFEANAKTADEKDQAKRVAKEGLTNEELAGGVRRTLASGSYAEPLISDTTKNLLIGGSALAVGTWILSFFL